MKLTIRSFKYGDAWIASLDEKTFIEIPAVDGESEQELTSRAIQAFERFSAE